MNMIGSLTQQAAARFGDAVAVIAGQDSLTFNEIDARVAAHARAAAALRW